MHQPGSGNQVPNASLQPSRPVGAWKLAAGSLASQSPTGTAVLGRRYRIEPENHHKTMKLPDMKNTVATTMPCKNKAPVNKNPRKT